MIPRLILKNCQTWWSSVTRSSSSSRDIRSQARLDGWFRSDETANHFTGDLQRMSYLHQQLRVGSAREKLQKQPWKFRLKVAVLLSARIIWRDNWLLPEDPHWIGDQASIVVNGWTHEYALESSSRRLDNQITVDKVPRHVLLLPFQFLAS